MQFLWSQLHCLKEVLPHLQPFTITAVASVQTSLPLISSQRNDDVGGTEWGEAHQGVFSTTLTSSKVQRNSCVKVKHSVNYEISNHKLLNMAHSINCQICSRQRVQTISAVIFLCSFVILRLIPPQKCCWWS